MAVDKVGCSTDHFNSQLVSCTTSLRGEYALSQASGKLRAIGNHRLRLHCHVGLPSNLNVAYMPLWVVFFPYQVNWVSSSGWLVVMSSVPG